MRLNRLTAGAPPHLRLPNHEATANWGKVAGSCRVMGFGSQWVAGLGEPNRCDMYTHLWVRLVFTGMNAGGRT
jgi:hypothetical protein